LALIYVDDDFNKRVLKKAMEQYENMHAWFQETRDPNP
jgi:hypothetical protein